MLICEALNVAMTEQLATSLHGAGRTTQSALIRDVPTYHISTQAVAELAREAAVGELVLTHLIPQIPNDPAREAQFVAGMREVYGGPITVARDTMRRPVVAKQVTG
jgi:ribonuclease Z